MKKTKLVTGIVLLVAALAIAVAGEGFGDGNGSEKRLTEDKIKALQSVSVDTIIKSVHQTNKLTTNVLNTNTADALPIQVENETQNQSLIIETNESVKTTKKKSKKSTKKKSNKKKRKKVKREKNLIKKLELLR